MNRLIIGTYTNNQSKGLYSVCLNNMTVSLAAEMDDPSYCLFSHQFNKLYVACEGEKGKLSCFNVEKDSLVFQNSIQTNSSGLVHVIMDNSKRYLFSVSYGDAKVLMIRLSSSGDLDKVVDESIHTGSGINKERQERAHAHSIWLTPNGKDVCVCDLGTDEIIVYRINFENEKIEKKICIKLPAGVGPRHLVFHPNGKFMYILSELTSEVFVYSWNSLDEINYVQRVQLLADGDKKSDSAAIRISKDGKFLYTSCRGEDILVVFSITKDGLLERIQSISASGKHPRDFILSEDENCLLCANRDSNNITIFDRSKVDGMLSFRKSIENIPNPISIVEV
ncbi:MAG TPA: lactonase family protein [Treponemataceae bacterium]|nr:lactonase family protein [Treponemataceae bacterium]